MSNATQFEELLRTDEALQTKLAEAAKAYAGDTTDDKAIFEATIGKVAAGVGLPFTYEEGLASSLASKRLSDDELDAVAGGDGFCIIIGGTTDIEVECSEITGQACAYIGITG